jgi:hypothetical protein
VDPQIHGALVGGLVGGTLGGLTVVAGVVLDVRMRGRYERRQSLEQAVGRLAALNPRTFALLRQHLRGGPTPEFEDRHSELLAANSEVSRLADSVSNEKAKAIRAASADLTDMWMGLLARAAEDIRPTDADGIVIVVPIRRMNAALYGEPSPEDASKEFAASKMGEYMRDGISAPELDDP